MNTSLSHQATYTYDGLNRLTHSVATGNAAYNLTFNYDQYGNMTCNTLANPNGPCPNVSYYSSTNQIHQIGSLTAGYDAAGNMTSDGTHTYQWDAEDRLRSVDGGSTETQVYNALGQQVQVNWAGGAWNTLFDPSGQWVGRNTAGHWDVGGVFHLDGRQFGIYIDQFYGIHENVLGSSDSSTNAAGGETGQSLFYPWGQTWSLGSAAWNFSAFEYGSPPPVLAPTLFRTYDPDVGRWMTPDPMGGDVTNPQSLNRYAYVTNNPTTLTDPLGLRPHWQQLYQEWKLSCGKEPICMYMWGQNPFFELDYLQTGGGYYDSGGGDFTWTSGYFNGAALSELPSHAGGFLGGGGVFDTPANLGPATAPLQAQAPQKKPCTPLADNFQGTPAAGIDTFADGLNRLLHPLEMIEINATMFVTGGVVATTGGAAIAGGCLEPTPAEPLTCGAAILGGGPTIAGGGFLIKQGVSFFKNYTLPAIKDWGCHE